jgi:uncharacterized protein YidB (DUF937 family)
MDLAGSLLRGMEQNPGGNNILGTLMQVVNNQPGGLAGIVESLQQGGMGEAVNSWIGAGRNQAVSADQIQGALGGGILQDLAGRLGVSPETASGHIAELLPGLIDHLTPNGQSPEGGLANAGANLLQGLLNKL